VEGFAALLLVFDAKPWLSVGVPGLGLKGLVDGVGRAVFGMSEDDGMGKAPPPEARDGENRDGSVPARVRLVAGCAADMDSGMAWLKSGKLSPFGDSGIVSRKGVEWPLVGGPHI
jgi:hypothetical protein